MRFPPYPLHTALPGLLGLLSLFMGALPLAQATEPVVPVLGKPVAATTLDAARGGFERVVSVNGEIMARTNIAIPDLAAMTAEQARLTQDALGAARMIQIGGNNYAAADLNLPNGATLVQNTLSGQDIRTATTISSTVNSMSLIKDINFQSTIRDAVLRSPGGL
jgi:hypothetical protein